MGRRYFSTTMFLTLCVAGYFALPKDPGGGAEPDAAPASARDAAHPPAAGRSPVSARQRAGLGRVHAELYVVAGRIDAEGESLAAPLASSGELAVRRQQRRIAQRQQQWEDEVDAVLRGLPRRPGPGDPEPWLRAWSDVAQAGEALRALASGTPGRAAWQAKLRDALGRLDRARRSLDALP